MVGLCISFCFKKSKISKMPFLVFAFLNAVYMRAELVCLHLLFSVLALLGALVTAGCSDELYVAVRCCNQLSVSGGCFAASYYKEY